MGKFVAQFTSLDNFVGIIFAIWAIPIIVGNAFQWRIQAPHVSSILALFTEQLLVVVLFSATDGTTTLFAFLSGIIFALFADFDLGEFTLDFLCQFWAKLSNLFDVLGCNSGGRGADCRNGIF